MTHPMTPGPITPPPDATRGTVALCVGEAGGPDGGLGDTQLRAALGIGKALRHAGFGAVVLPPDRWTELPPDARAVVALSARFDPATVPDEVDCLAWAVDEPLAWPRHTALPLFDAVLAASRLLADRLTAAGRAARAEVLPLATDPGTAPGAPAKGLVDDPAMAQGGIVPLVVFDLLAAGTRPVLASRLGLGDLGLDLGGDDDDDTGRLTDLVHRDHTWTARATTLIDVLEHLRADRTRSAGVRGPIVGFFPDFRATNPYQAMLYGALPGNGIRLAPLRRPTEQVVARDDGGDLLGRVLHVHWTSAVVQVATTPEEAAERLDRFRALVRDLKDRGGRLVWTVHNVLPHECPFPELEVELCRLLAAEADVVHVMCPETPALTSPHYELDPQRVVVVPHSSYTGVYADVISRAEARRRLGVRDHDVALLALGGIRTYRGLDVLLSAFESLLEWDVRVKLLVAGRPGPSPEVARWQEQCERHPRVVARFQHIPDADLQVWLRAADIAVLPYRAILNSGAFKLAETFGLPIVAPRDGCVGQAIDPAYAVGFDPMADGDLLRALRDAVDLVTDPAAAGHAVTSALGAAVAYPPEAMGADFAAALAPWLNSAAEVPHNHAPAKSQG